MKWRFLILWVGAWGGWKGIGVGKIAATKEEIDGRGEGIEVVMKGEGATMGVNFKWDSAITS